MQRSIVDFPEPDDPITQVTSPVLTEKLISLSTEFSPKSFFNPLTVIIFSGIYITALAIYSIKGKKSPNYIYNINFFGYILGITVTSVVLSFSLISLILVIKKELYLDVFILLIAIISFTILCLLLTKFIKLIKLDDKTIVTTNKKEQQELDKMFIEASLAKTNEKTATITTPTDDNVEIL